MTLCPSPIARDSSWPKFDNICLDALLLVTNAMIAAERNGELDSVFAQSANLVAPLSLRRAHPVDVPFRSWFDLITAPP